MIWAYHVWILSALLFIPTVLFNILTAFFERLVCYTLLSDWLAILNFKMPPEIVLEFFLVLFKGILREWLMSILSSLKQLSGMLYTHTHTQFFLRQSLHGWIYSLSRYKYIMYRRIGWVYGHMNQYCMVAITFMLNCDLQVKSEDCIEVLNWQSSCNVDSCQHCLNM